MKNPKSNLFELIKSLDKFEKGHFRRYCTQTSTKKNSVYIKLFDAIERQVQSGKDYSESEIKEKFVNEKYIRQFAVLKNYLYKLILKSLRYYNVNSTEMKLDELIYNIDFLSRKSQYSESLRIIIRAKHMAEKDEKYEKMLEIIKREKNLLKIAGIKYKNKTIVDLHNEEAYIYKKLKNINDYEKITDKLINFSQKIGVVRTETDFLKFKKIASSPLLKKENLAISYISKLHYHFALAAYHYLTLDYSNAYISIKNFINFLESHPLKLEANSYNYINNLQNLMYMTTTFGKYDEAESILTKIKRQFYILKKNLLPYVQIVLNLRNYHLEIFLYMHKKEFNKPVKLIESVKEELINIEANAEIKLALYFLIATYYFEVKKYDNALEWINRTLNDKEAAEFPDLYSSARILNLIIHFELGNNKLIESNVKSFYKYLLMRKALYGFEKIALKFIKKLPDISNQEELYGTLFVLRKDFKNISENPYEKIVMQYFDFISWIDMKINPKELRVKK